MKKTEMGSACSMHGAGRDEYTVLVGKLEGRRSLGKPMGRWEDNIQMNLREVGLRALAESI